MFSEKGQALLEVVVVISVLALIIGALVFATISSLRNAQLSKNQSQATKLAQEGIERVRTGRDRNGTINNLDASVSSWNGANVTSTCPNPGSLWCYRISGNTGNCDRPDLIPAGLCVLNVDSMGNLNLSINGYSFQPTQTSPLPSGAEGIPTTNPVFKRAIFLSDDLNHNKIFGGSDDDWQNQKEVTVLVTWTDFAGSHQSKLVTILRRI